MLTNVFDNVFVECFGSLKDKRYKNKQFNKKLKPEVYTHEISADHGRIGLWKIICIRYLIWCSGKMILGSEIR